MNVAMVPGSAGLIGSETVRFFACRGFQTIGVDNDMRSVFFGQEASTRWQRQRLEAETPGYRHLDADIRDPERCTMPAAAASAIVPCLRPFACARKSRAGA
jgi:CDP-paratose 2-epimerase